MALLSTIAQVYDVDPASPVRVCDACFVKLGNQLGGVAKLPPRTSRFSAEVVEGRGEISISDFDIIKHLGRGAFGQVLEVRADAGADLPFHFLPFVFSFVSLPSSRVPWPQVKDRMTNKSYALKVRLNERSEACASAAL